MGAVLRLLLPSCPASVCPASASAGAASVPAGTWVVTSVTVFSWAVARFPGRLRVAIVRVPHQESLLPNGTTPTGYGQASGGITFWLCGNVAYTCFHRLRLTSI